MSVIKSTRKREQFYPSDENLKWLQKMEEKGVSKSSIINMAIDILKPRTGNLTTTEDCITMTIAEKRLVEMKKELDYDKLPY